MITSKTLSNWYNLKTKLVLEGVLIGACTGLLISIYRLILERASDFRNLFIFNHSNNIYAMSLWFLFLILSGYFVGILIKKEPMISGSGIPQVEGVLIRRLTMNYGRVLINKIIGGVLSIFAGLSLGREGPSVQMGACIGGKLSTLFKRSEVEQKFLLSCGASAGLAAAFNAPFAGIMFVLEEIHKNFSPLVLLPAMSACITADFVSKQFFGINSVFNFTNITALPLKYYASIIGLGILLGLLGVFFNKNIFLFQDLYKKYIKIEFRPIIPFVCAGILGLILPEVLGGGHQLITTLVADNFAFKALIIILIVKFYFTMLSFSSSAPGGIFLPLLVIGALIGNLYGICVTTVFHIDSSYINNFIVLAMAGYFTAIVKSPLTGCILITEMTGSFSHLLSLSIVCIVAYIVSDLLRSRPIYEELLERMLDDKVDNCIYGNEDKIILEMPVCISSVADNKQVKDIKWNDNILLVGIKRGNEEIIPKGNTMILPFDYLSVLTDKENYSATYNFLQQLCSDAGL